MKQRPFSIQTEKSSINQDTKLHIKPYMFNLIGYILKGLCSFNVKKLNNKF